jgi:hypothetical protein
MPSIKQNTTMFGILLVAVVAAYDDDDIITEDLWNVMKTCVADKCQPLLQECTTEISRCFADMYLMLEEDTVASTQQITGPAFDCIPTVWDNGRGDFCDPNYATDCEDSSAGKFYCDGRGVHCIEQDVEKIDPRCKQETSRSETYNSITLCAYCNGCLDHSTEMKSEWLVMKQGTNCWPNCTEYDNIKANQSMCPALGDALGDAPVVVFGVAVLGIVVLALSLLFT